MSKVKVEYNTYTHVTSEADPDAKWDRDSTTADTSIEGIKLVKKGNFYDIEVGFDIDDSKVYFLVYVDYDTGDSFGTDGNQIEFVDLFETRAKAEEVQEVIQKHYKDGNDGTLAPNKYQFQYQNEQGTEIKGCATWMGYFETLNSVEIKKVTTL